MKKSFVKYTGALGEEKGATSVLVIFMLLVLVSLGSFAIVSANVNYKLNQKTVRWHQEYYQLDALAEEYIAALDSLLFRAECFALDYITNRQYENINYNELPHEIQKYFVQQWETTENKENLFSIFLEKLYFSYISIHINELSNIYPQLEIHYTVDQNEIIENSHFIYEPIDFFPIIVENIINTGNNTDNFQTNIIVATQIISPNYNFSYTGIEITASRYAGKRYEILQWKQENEPFKYEDTVQPWDSNTIYFVE